ncbi:MAG: SpoIIE family protein phosphatase [Rhodothermales bacterium]
MNILVVDDEPDLALLVRQKFRKRIRAGELTFTYAHDGVEALEHLQADPTIDIVVTDINMPRMDGLTLLDRLSSWERPIKVVIVSAYGDMSNIRTAMNRGAFDFITKPINFDDLNITLDKTHRELDAHRLASTLQEQLAVLQRELDIARNIQLSSLPQQFPAFPDEPRCDLHAAMHAAKEVGGDFYDFFMLDEDHVGFAVGDVAGKGLPAALFMTNTRTLLRATALQGMPPEACVRHVNRALHSERVKGMFVTLVYAILDLRTGMVTYCNAGHNAPYHLSANGVAAVYRTGGLAVCLARDFAYTSKTLQLAPGDTLFVYTDGVPEANNAANEDFDDGRLEAHLSELHGAAPKALNAAVLQAVRRFAGDAPQRDDITLLALKYHG